MRLSRFLLLAAAGFAAIGSLAVVQSVFSQGPQRTGLISSTGTAAIGGPFSMVDETGARVTQADLMGRPTVLFFGFTWCPDVCPTTLFELTALMDGLGDQADAMNFVMVTADPERDSPEILAEYLSAFDERFRGFTGTPEEVARIAEAYKVQIEKVGEGPDYTVNHTASVYLMDEQNRFVGTITHHEDRATALEKLRRLGRTA